MNLADLPERLLLDGGMGTSLIARGLDVGKEATAMWNISRPEEVLAVHRDFADAGAQALQTNTFVANRMLLATLTGRSVLPDELREINRAACELVRQASESALVIGSVGPCGDVPPPQGSADLHELEATFAEQAAFLKEGEVDFLHVETMAHPKELRAAMRGCRAGAPELPLVVSMACKTSGDGFKTTQGFSWELLLAVAQEEKADGIGLNCVMTPRQMAPLLEELVARASVPVFAKPTIAPDGAAPLFPEEFADGVELLFSIGARAVGGCCGTSADDIELAAQRLAD